MRGLGLPVLLFILVAGCASHRTALPSKPTESRPPLLAALDGEWLMVGDVMGEPVTYNLEVSAVLARGFTELHMTDVRSPPQYEARVFIGYDEKAGQIIVHWLDVFGGRGSIPHGTGQLADNTIEFTIPYSDGPFRDRLTLDAASNKWRFTIESSQGSGQWKHFAAYEIRRK